MVDYIKPAVVLAALEFIKRNHKETLDARFLREAYYEVRRLRANEGMDFRTAMSHALEPDTENMPAKRYEAYLSALSYMGYVVRTRKLPPGITWGATEADLDPWQATIGRSELTPEDIRIIRLDARACEQDRIASAYDAWRLPEEFMPLNFVEIDD